MEKKAESKDQTAKLIEGLEKAYEKLVEFKRYKKSPLIVSRNGEIIEISPEDIPPTTRYRRGTENS